MRRGTTPTHVFTTDIDLTDAEAVYVTYKQNGETILERTRDDIELTEDTLTLSLTQAETLSFRKGLKVYIQIRARFADGSAVASDIIGASVDDILKDGEI